jgi:tRNA nucleotidyltransferase/poly(A) polymerase
MSRIHLADNFVGNLGVEAYRVGGSVRDEIIGRAPKDADYIVRGVRMGALADLLVSHGCKIAPITARDKAHLGWRTAIKGVGLIEIVLPRVERGTGVGRDMEITVDHTLSLAADAERRDFTFNALYKGVGDGYPVTAAEGGVSDPTGSGLYDLQHRMIRVTHPNSFKDDPLRILRALRFVSTLDADLADDTYLHMLMLHEAVTGLTVDGHTSGTVYDELSKLLMGQVPAKALRIARDTGVLGIVLPELAPMLGFDQGSRYHDLSTDEHTFKALETAAKVDASLRVRWALLFHDAGKPASAWVGKDGRTHYYATRLILDNEAILFTEDHEVVSERLWKQAAARMNVPKGIRDDVSVIVRDHMIPVKTKNPGTRARRMRVKYGDDLAHDLLLHRTCDLSGKGVKVALNHIEHIAKLERLRSDAAAIGVPASVKALHVNGKDAMAVGIKGRKIGIVLARILDEVVCEPTDQMLSREWQLKRLEALA